jgi:hypothetical protein
MDRVESLLESLNEWEREYGTTYGDAAGLASTGESNARIAELKRQLVEAGAVFHWDGERYVLDELVEGGTGHEGPSAPPRSR